MNTKKSNPESKNNPSYERHMSIEGIDFKTKQMLSLIQAMISLGLHNNTIGVTEEDTRPEVENASCFVGLEPSETFYFLGSLAEDLKNEILECTDALLKMN